MATQVQSERPQAPSLTRCRASRTCRARRRLRPRQGSRGVRRLPPPLGPAPGAAPRAPGRGPSGDVEPTGHAVRMDALHLIRAAAEFADTIERDAQTASAAQLRRTEEEVSRRQRELQDREARGRALPPGERAPARGDAERGQSEARELLAGDAARCDPGAARGRGAGRAAARAVSPPGDRADELRPRRGRADARVGARAGCRDHSPRAGGRRAAARRGRARRGRDRACRPDDRRRRRGRRRGEPRTRTVVAGPGVVAAARGGACRTSSRGHQGAGDRGASVLAAELARPTAARSAGHGDGPPSEDDTTS